MAYNLGLDVFYLSNQVINDLLLIGVRSQISSNQ